MITDLGIKKSRFKCICLIVRKFTETLLTDTKKLNVKMMLFPFKNKIKCHYIIRITTFCKDLT